MKVKDLGEEFDLIQDRAAINNFAELLMTKDEYEKKERFSPADTIYPDVDYFVEGNIFEVIDVLNRRRYLKVTKQDFGKFYEFAEIDIDGNIIQSKIYRCLAVKHINNAIEQGDWRLYKRK